MITLRMIDTSRYAVQSKLTLLKLRTPLAFGLPFFVYLLTLAPTIYNLDSAELTTAAVTGGLVRATGYPLYLVLGHLWSYLPIGDAGYRMNLFSAFNGALTVALAERIMRRWQIGSWATIGALGLLVVAPYFWALSLIAEVYTLHTALMAGIVLLLLRWADDPTPDRLALVGLVVGLSLGHHAATVLLIPGCIWYMLTVAPQRALTSRSLVLVPTALLVGLSIYSYLPLRYGGMPSFNYAGKFDAAGVFIPVNLRTPGGLWWLVSGRAFAGEMMAYRGTELWRELSYFGVQLWRAFFAFGIGPGLLGIIVLWRRDWRLNGMLLLMFGCSAGFYINYRVVDKNTMFLPTYLVWALWLGLGYQWVLDWIKPTQDTSGRSQVVGFSLMRGLMVGAVLLALGWNWQLVDLSNDWSARTRGETILRRVEPNALLIGWWDTVPLIEYLQLVEGKRPDVQTINRFLIDPQDMSRLIWREIHRRPVYIDRLPPGLPQLVKAEPVGPIHRLHPRDKASQPQPNTSWPNDNIGFASNPK